MVLDFHIYVLFFPFFICTVIAPCIDNELNEFPLRMRDWLKNVLVSLYERDEDNNMLSEKQKLRVSLPLCLLHTRHLHSTAWQGNTTTHSAPSQILKGADRLKAKPATVELTEMIFWMWYFIHF